MSPTKGGVTDGALRVAYYHSRGFVSCNFIFHIVDHNLALLSIKPQIIQFVAVIVSPAGPLIMSRSE